MLRRMLLLAIIAVVGLAGVVPARSAGPKLVTIHFCTGDGRLQIFDLGPVADDINLNGDIGCQVEGSTGSYPMHVEAIIGASTVAAAGDCGPNGVGPLTGLRMRMKMTLKYEGNIYRAIRTWTGKSAGDFPGSNIDGNVRDPIGVVKLGRFRLEPFPGWYCSSYFSYIRLWGVLMAPSPIA
jgi:hypothetical protein